MPKKKHVQAEDRQHQRSKVYKKTPTRYGEQNNQDNVALYDHHMQKKFSKYVSSAEDREDSLLLRQQLENITFWVKENFFNS